MSTTTSTSDTAALDAAVTALIATDAVEADNRVTRVTVIRDYLTNSPGLSARRALSALEAAMTDAGHDGWRLASLQRYDSVGRVVEHLALDLSSAVVANLYTLTSGKGGLDAARGLDSLPRGERAAALAALAAGWKDSRKASAAADAAEKHTAKVAAPAAAPAAAEGPDDVAAAGMTPAAALASIREHLSATLEGAADWSPADWETFGAGLVLTVSAYAPEAVSA